MPATNFNWPFNDKPPVYQVFGTKRKNGAEESNLDVVEEVETKRRCTAARGCTAETWQDSLMDVTGQMESPAQHHSQVSHTACTKSLPSHVGPLSHESHFRHQLAIHSNTVIQDLAQHHLEVTLNNRVPPLPNAAGDNIENNNNNNILYAAPGQDLNCVHSSQPDLQNKMIMDLNEGVYSTVNLPLNPQTDAEYEAACSMVAAMEAEGAPNPHQYFPSYCDARCVGGDRSPNSGKVRCPCRPSWEGMIDARPYVSDYY